MTDAKYTLLGSEFNFEKYPNLKEYLLAIAITSFIFFTTIILLLLIGYSEDPIKRRQYDHYFVDFDTQYNRPVRSVQQSRVMNIPPRTNNNRFEPEPLISNITHDDFTHLGFDRGHLSPWMTLGAESMKIINVVPQYPCHNQQVWKMFELYVRDHHMDGTVETYPIYTTNNFKISLKNKLTILYIPDKLCKKIDGVDYCLPHDTSLCGKPWCEHMDPPLPDVDIRTCALKK